MIIDRGRLIEWLMKQIAEIPTEQGEWPELGYILDANWHRARGLRDGFERVLSHLDATASPSLEELRAQRAIRPIVGVAAQCEVCGRRKAPRGRSVPAEMANGMCGNECPGYDQPPEPYDLWPGETREEFGY
mgnify:CR=1 FL=1